MREENNKSAIKDEKAEESNKKYSKNDLHKLFFRNQVILILTLAIFLSIAGTLINIYFEKEKRDGNLKNVAVTIASSPVLTEKGVAVSELMGKETFKKYLEYLGDMLTDIDVISVLDENKVRVYHTNAELIGKKYENDIPDFREISDEQKMYYAVNEHGTSGYQRRAYAPIYDRDGNYKGCVMAIMLMENIRIETMQTLLIFTIICGLAIGAEFIISGKDTLKVKKSLLGYEPDVFSAMYKIRDNILESIDEGIIAIDREGKVQFANKIASNMVGYKGTLSGKPLGDICDISFFANTFETGEKEFNIHDAISENDDVMVDTVPIKNGNDVIGAVAILHNRAEYTKLMEDLTGTRYLVDSMRANNHDFTNKLHVILGLIQMEMYDKATEYIENITMVQRAIISDIMKAVNEPALAALLIGKTSRASELNVKFVLREGCSYSKSDLHLPSEALVTIVGNLIDNAFYAMNEKSEEFDSNKELTFGIYSKPGRVLITVEDTGDGIDEENLDHIFENGFSTKGKGRGTGLYQVKLLVERLCGNISVESQKGVGTSFTVSFESKSKKN